MCRLAAAACRRGGRPPILPESSAALSLALPSSIERPRVAGIVRYPVGLGDRSGRGDGSERSMGGAEQGVHFLDACFLCRKPLAGNRDIFMYRGDTAFCSDECRSAQMAADEAAERKARASSAKAVAYGALPSREAEGGPQERGKVRAGSILVL